jgi:hypothetical protein
MAFQKPKILYENRLKDATPVASSTAAGDFNVLNLRDFRPYTWWKPASMPATVTVDAGSAKAADYAVVWGHDLFARSATFEVRGSTDNFVASDVLVATRTPTSDKPLVLTWISTSFRYWRIRLTGAAAPSIAIAAAGVALETDYVPNGFDPLNRRIEGDFNRTNKGHPLGRAVEFEEWSDRLEFEPVTWTWLRTSFTPAWLAHLRSSPFVFAWDAGDHPDEIYLVNTKGEFKATHRAGSMARLAIEISGIAP